MLGKAIRSTVHTSIQLEISTTWDVSMLFVHINEHI